MGGSGGSDTTLVTATLETYTGLYLSHGNHIASNDSAVLRAEFQREKRGNSRESSQESFPSLSRKKEMRDNITSVSQTFM